MVATADPAAPGEVLLGKYRVEDVIGVGGMGRVVKAQHLYLQQPVAIKILLPQMTSSHTTVARFLREAQATVKLRSEHIARVMDVGTLPDGTPFIVMEFLDGFDLNQILRHHGPQQAQPVVDLILQACEGMSEAHSVGIIHRDIKPSNFFITRRVDGSNLLKILDFGISGTPAELSDLTGTQTVVGTPTYMAPEQMRTARSTDPRSDIWSMGVVMYQMLAGRPPFEAESYAELVLKVGTESPTPLNLPLPPGLEGIVMRCLEKDPNNRIQSVGDLARMIAPYASDPHSAQQSAERAARILARDSRNNMGMGAAGQFGSNGGLGLSTPPALTPKSWHHTQGSSVGGAAGQMGTKVVRSGRGKVIGIVATLVIGAGAGGFVVANSMGGDTKHVGAPNPLETTMSSDKADNADVAKPDPVVAKPDPVVAKPDPVVAKPDPVVVKPDPVVVKPDPVVVKPDPVVVKPDPVVVKKADPVVVKKADPVVVKKADPVVKKKTDPTTTTTKKKKKDDLFDDRH